jgi:hypothetical protein
MRSLRRPFKTTAHAPKNVASSMSARRAGSLGAKSFCSLLCGSQPSRTGVQSKRRGRDLWRMGAWRDRCPNCGCTLGGARPWRASVRPSGSPARSAWLGYGAGMLLVSQVSASILSCHLGRGVGRQGSHGTGWFSRWHRSSTAACSGRRRRVAHRSRALPPAPQRKQ